MTPEMIAVAHQCTIGSSEARLSFPQVLAALGDAGIERYDADLVRGTKTYFAADGSSTVVEDDPAGAPTAAVFDGAQIVEAIRKSQAQAIDYRTFCRLVAEAGCAGYHVSLPGRRAVYYGRAGDVHVEHFPD